MKITWNTDVRAPGCPGEIVADDGRSVLIQTDWDYPSVASSFGWSLADVRSPCPEEDFENPADVSAELCEEYGQVHHLCKHSHTDGTVDCPDCGVTASDFINAASEWLDDHDGEQVDDPGYFE